MYPGIKPTNFFLFGDSANHYPQQLNNILAQDMSLRFDKRVSCVITVNEPRLKDKPIKFPSRGKTRQNSKQHQRMLSFFFFWNRRAQNKRTKRRSTSGTEKKAKRLANILRDFDWKPRRNQYFLICLCSCSRSLDSEKAVQLLAVFTVFDFTK